MSFVIIAKVHFTNTNANFLFLLFKYHSLFTLADPWGGAPGARPP